MTSGCHVPWISWISTDLRKTEKKCICATSTSYMTCIFPLAATPKPLLRSNFMLMTCHGQTDLYIPTSGTLVCINQMFFLGSYAIKSHQLQLYIRKLEKGAIWISLVGLLVHVFSILNYGNSKKNLFSINLINFNFLII